MSIGHVLTGDQRRTSSECPVERRREFGPCHRKRAEITLGPGSRSIGIKEGARCAMDEIIENGKLDRNDNSWPCGVSCSLVGDRQSKS